MADPVTGAGAGDEARRRGLARLAGSGSRGSGRAGGSGGSRGSGGSAGSGGSGGLGLVEAVTTWICRLAALNVMWLLQTLAGGVLLGLAPATSVLSQQLRTGLLDDVQVGYYRDSWRRWRQEFWRSQQRYLIPLLTPVVLGFYLWMLRGQAVAVSIAILLAVYLCWLLHLPAVAARADEAGPDREHGPTRLWLLALRAFAATPVPFVLAGLVGAAAAVLGYLYLPGALVFAVPSVPALAASMAARQVPERLLTPAD
ncbi:DUF624 domain-containing protein [Occultella glacieicola]|uniref:DUF624 domain-containing protein n=1 Tax=Occultella glacieicola TaxID=2518684 RepID=A0ABY2E490_9MICO|nr:DUF624 domain-containing protein [Occultella glacieicola]TDE94232.1 DUF624 domain-containing protein [Occultella glacieicola]